MQQKSKVQDGRSCRAGRQAQILATGVEPSPPFISALRTRGVVVMHQTSRPVHSSAGNTLRRPCPQLTFGHDCYVAIRGQARFSSLPTIERTTNGLTLDQNVHEAVVIMAVEDLDALEGRRWSSFGSCGAAASRPVRGEITTSEWLDEAASGLWCARSDLRLSSTRTAARHSPRACQIRRGRVCGVPFGALADNPHRVRLPSAPVRGHYGSSGEYEFRLPASMTTRRSSTSSRRPSIDAYR